MNIPTHAHRPLLVTAVALCLAPLTACSSGGRCVSAPGAMTPATDKKVLVNLDSQGVALGGYDPVAYFTDARPVKGDPKIRSTRGGAVYTFASVEHKAAFDADPAKYEPQFGGYCAYAASIDKVSLIDPNYWEIIDGRLILQHNQKAWDLWHRDAAGNLVKADKNWPGLVNRTCN
jgi:YHS domain-containing protein